MRLSGEQFQHVTAALLDAFISIDELRMLVRYHLNFNLNTIIADRDDLRMVIFKMLTWAEQQDRVLDLIGGALKEVPTNVVLIKLQAEASQWFDTDLAVVPPLSLRQPPGGTAASTSITIDVFICYSHLDAAKTRQVQELLRAANLSVWLDEGLEPGTPNWQNAISSAIRQAQTVVALLSPNSLASKWVQREISYAETHEKRIFPVVLNGDERSIVPLSLIDAQRIDGRGRLAAAVKDELLPAMLRYLSSIRSANILPLDIEWIEIPAGAFLMGSVEEDMEQSQDDIEQSQNNIEQEGKRRAPPEDEQWQHSVFLAKYHITKHPITNTQYLQFVRAAGYQAPKYWLNGNVPDGKENHPVTNVSWHDARAYCTWLSKTSGRSVRLPSEAEWEKAARGEDGRLWPWGNNPPDAERCNFGDNTGNTTPVDSCPAGASPYGVLDMAGNVWEWTNSQPTKYPYIVLNDREDVNDKGGDKRRVLRGGSYQDQADDVRCAIRHWTLPEYRVDHFGFRVVAVSSSSDL